MYQYDDYDRALVRERVAQFRDQIQRRLSGELSEEEFLPLRLQNGLYLQKHAYMLRVAIPYGTLSARQMRALAHIAREYDRGYGHFTTRQNIQFNWIELERVADILDWLAEHDMHAIQTSGNCVRNITTEAFAGVAADEYLDPRPLAEILRQWSTVNPEFLFLPRKFKIALCAAEEDRAAVQVHDIGLQLYRDEAGELRLRVLVGGGLGRTPIIAQVLREGLAWRDLLSYVEAILRVYNRHGRRDNKYKARIKILVHELGVDELGDLVEEEWARIRHGALELPAAEIERIEAQFRPPAYEDLPAEDATVTSLRLDDAQFARWLRANTAPHHQPGYAIVTLSLKPAGKPPARPAGAVAGTQRARARQRQRRPRRRHHRLPGARLLLARQRPLDPDRRAHLHALRRSSPPARHRRTANQDFWLHQRLRPPSRRPHRHPRRRPQGRGVLSDHARRRAR